MSSRMRVTKGHRNNRRAHHSAPAVTISKDSSSNPHMRHRVNPTTGEYRGRKVLEIKSKVSRKEAIKAEKSEENKKEGKTQKAKK